MTNEFTVSPEFDGRRVDIAVAGLAELSRSTAARLISEGAVTVNGQPPGKSRLVKEGDIISVTVPESINSEAVPQDIPLNVIFEDDELIVIDKPKGMVVHPAAGNPDGTLVNALLYHCGGSLSGIGGVIRPGIVHRIDKDTGGLLVAAKNDKTHLFLSEQIKAHSFLREYEAVCFGFISPESGRIDAPIGRHPVKRKCMAVLPETSLSAKNAVTDYNVILEFSNSLGKFSHVRLKLHTGRTHQIRVHMTHIGHPLAGDEVYGHKKVIKPLRGQCLYAKKLGFVHPSGKWMEFTGELPDWFTDFLNFK